MATHDQLLELYAELIPENHSGKKELYVVPLIRHDYKESDYLYLLYRDIIENRKDQFSIKSVSVWKHWIFAWRALSKKNVILHYHWLECTDFKSLTGMVYKLICIFLYKLFGGKLVWTIHNKMPHDRKYQQFNYRIQSWMAARADLLHIHCSSMIDEISRFYDQPAGKFRVVEHPEFPSKVIKRERAINKLNETRNLGLKSSDQIFLMFGNISAYKQIGKVCSMFTGLPSHKKLLIVGPVKKGQMSVFYGIKDISKSAENIRLVPHFISEKMVPYYMNAADCVVFNYEKILTSGGVELARSYGRPIIAPNLGCLSELDDKNSTLFNSQEELNQLLSEFEIQQTTDA